MSPIRYSPLNEANDEIRLLTIRPGEVSAASPTTGRTYNAWDAVIITMNDWKASAVHLNHTEDPVFCMLETVSLADYSSAYRAYQSATPSSTIAWEDFSLEQPPSLSSSSLPGWRGPGVTGGHPMDNVPSLEWPLLYRPRYSWGDYEALSYMWGSDNQSGRIYVNGEIIPVQKSVEDALRRLRILPETQQGMKFWIDAICINQSDIPERNSQVKKMRDIYTNAWSTVVWLGDETEGSNEAIEIISGVAHLVLESDSANKVAFESSYGDVRWDHLISLFQRPYWRRVWIIQELAMNHHLTMFICGDRAFHRGELVEILKFCINHDRELKHILANRETPSRQAVPQEKTPQSPSAGVNDPWLVFAHLGDLFSPMREIDSTFALSQRASASDDRDKIYGILSLLPHELAIRTNPDYNLSIREVYIGFARSMLNSDGLSSLLSWAGGLDGSHGPAYVPSWCPDWTTSNYRNHIQWLRKRRANKSANLASHITDNNELLVCQGLKVDAVTNLSTATLQSQDLVSASEREPVNDLAEAWPNAHDPTLSEALKTTLLMEHPGRSNIGRSVLEIPWVQYQRDSGNGDGDNPHLGGWRRLWKDLHDGSLFGAFNKFRKANADFRIGGHHLQHFFPQLWPQYYFSDMPSYPGGPLNKIRNSVKIAYDMKLAAISLVGRKLFTTASGHLGLAPEATREGDIVAILGCPFPVVLRPQGSLFRYVGECYVYGLMDGEAFDDDSTARFSIMEFNLC